jgi:LPXTG-motif cell wall-anchored protein
MRQTPGQSLFPAFCVLLLGAAFLGAGALFFNYHPAVEYALATENETRREIAPLILMGAGSALLGVGAFLLFRRREH